MKLLQHPLTRGLDLDDPQTTIIRKRIINEKPFLKQIYQEWYGWIARSLPEGEGPVLELGSGAGFLNEYVSPLITSEIFFCNFVDAILDGCDLPFKNGSLKGIVFVDVLHHLPRAEGFFKEAARCIRTGGRIVMVEPWITPWSKFIYTRLHHEPLDTGAAEWKFPSTGPLSGANSALPWIIFCRDRKIFERDYPQLKISSIKAGMPFRYLLSGGISLRSIMPGWSFPLWKKVEERFDPWSNKLGMFARIVLERAA
ncbi:MAG TPA: methyltransferase domain-containing protein [Deltaproteobacteria bacterium]|nr:methyltransferase domain-containing protein [Deltaproteobacteria bacterium]